MQRDFEHFNLKRQGGELIRKLKEFGTTKFATEWPKLSAEMDALNHIVDNPPLIIRHRSSLPFIGAVTGVAIVGVVMIANRLLTAHSDGKWSTKVGSEKDKSQSRNL